MTKLINHTGKSKSIPSGLTIAVSVSMIITLILSVLIANSLNTEIMTWEQAGYWIMGMLYMASLIGGKCAWIAIKRQRVAVALMSGALYWGVLLCITALLFGGNFSAVWETAGIIGAGCGSAVLLPAPIKQKYGKRISLS